MDPSEGDRHELYDVLRNLLGVRQADTLMSYLLPPTEIAAVGSEISELRSEMNQRFDRMFIAQIGGYAAVVIAVFLS